jgi:saccharopine dehydrogenase-like NADP-dependent oxidoreductase
MLKTILLIGAGKSATVLIDFLIEGSKRLQWHTIVADASLQQVKEKIGETGHARAEVLDINDAAKRFELIDQADVVISMMPPSLHYLVATDCLQLGKHLLTASYADDKMKALHEAAKNKGLLFLCEMGLDPGIDHMSAMQLLDDIRAKGGRITAFKSHCGGLVAPESDNNPWRYKISWNPRNVVLAGKAGATYKKDGLTTTVSYKELFSNCNTVQIDGLDKLACYPNRDSLSYIPIYQLQDAHTFIRTTLRYPIFCQAWQAIALANLADENKENFEAGISIKKWAAGILPYVNDGNKLLLQYLGLFDDTPVPENAFCGADVLQHLLEGKLQMQPTDKDMIAMLHEIAYVDANDNTTYAISSLLIKGDDSLRTAMAKTVGLPLGIAAQLLVQEKLKATGVQIPVIKEIYEPVLAVLEEFGISFT